MGEAVIGETFDRRFDIYVPHKLELIYQHKQIRITMAELNIYARANESTPIYPASARKMLGKKNV